MKKYDVEIIRHSGEVIKKTVLSNKSPEEIYEDLYIEYDLYDDEDCYITES